ncbi:Rieske 2Fe-2S domain-containing protein, partial [Arthrobacter sp. USHLN218]|uniref:Rieske 2Fe-2S domain-containing protein n=1 Tax=Arthrobacter sp. USHLN218 TaxID=3081232 RepID=UPI00301B680F
MATLPGHTYTDAAIFRAEQERIFEQMWFCAIRSSDLDKAGAWKTVQIGRESVLISRTRKGGIRAFYNICRHRGV